MKKIYILLTIILLASEMFSQTTINGSISHTTGTRTYQLYVPAIYDGSTAVPLVLNLHGYGSSNTQQMFYGDFKPIADTANFLILAPQGLNDNTGTAHWNANWGTGVDDVGFLSALIDSIASEYNINTDRVYSTGMSNGGFMSFTLAGELSDKIAAIASVTGTMSILQIPNNTVTRPMPIMQIHGTADPTVNYNGDQYFLSVDSVLNYWIAHNNCSATPVITSVPDINTGDGCTAERFDYLGGDNGAEVVHYKVTNGEHTWPGAGFTIGVTNQDFDASTEIWKFFSKYERSTLVSITELPSEDWVQLLSENPASDLIHARFLTGEQVEILCFNVEGKLVHSQTGKTDVSLNVSSWNDGVYIIVFQSENQKTSSIKIVKG